MDITIINIITIIIIVIIIIIIIIKLHLNCILSNDRENISTFTQDLPSKSSQILGKFVVK